MYKKTVLKQYLITIAVNLLTVSYGTSVGWMSANYLVLKSNETTPLKDGPLTDNELSWIGSMLCIGGFFGAFIFGYLGDRIGLKMTLLLTSLVHITSWILKILVKNVYYLYAARILAGISSGGAFVLVPNYVAQISDDDIRGRLGSLLMLLANTGILLSYTTGNYLSYIVEAYVLMCFPIMFFLIFIFCPSEKQFQIQQEIEEIEQEEILLNNTGVMVKNPVIVGLNKFENTIASQRNNVKLTRTENKIKLKDFSSRPVKKALLIGIVLMILHDFCGVYYILNYTAPIFSESGSNISPHLSAIIIGTIQIIGIYFSTLLVDRVGRKILIIFSGCGTAFGLSILGIFKYLSILEFNLENFNWIPVTSLSLTILLASCGLLSLPYVILAEIMPLKLRSLGLTICFALSWIQSFGMLKTFPALGSIIGLHGCIIIFMVICLIGVIFVYFIVPETKGKSFDEIFILLN